MKKCSYCDKEKKLTKEHIWPKCIINKMPELEAKYLDSHKIFTASDLVISDVCADCNNKKLSVLDSYLCKLFDKYFNLYIENEKEFIFEYDYELLLRTLLKITYNSSRTVKRTENDFSKFAGFILEGGKSYENIVIKLDIVLPSVIDGVALYPKSARCGFLDVGLTSDNFLLRMVSINSFYFYVLISKNEVIPDSSVDEFQKIFNRIPGTIIHPYQENITIRKFSGLNTYDLHIDFMEKTQNHFEKYIDKKNNH
jgi:hypothetical protein